MSQFYTNVQLAGDTILYRGYQDGTPVQFRGKFSPTLYVPSKKKEKYKTLDGRSVAPIEFTTARDAREFIKTYDGVEVIGEFHELSVAELNHARELSYAKFRLNT